MCDKIKTKALNLLPCIEFLNVNSIYNREIYNIRGDTYKKHCYWVICKIFSLPNRCNLSFWISAEKREIRIRYDILKFNLKNIICFCECQKTMAYSSKIIQMRIQASVFFSNVSGLLLRKSGLLSLEFWIPT